MGFHLDLTNKAKADIETFKKAGNKAVLSASPHPLVQLKPYLLALVILHYI